MKVLKFGGTSVGTVESLRNVKRIVESLDEPAIVVVSALGGLTDRLIQTARDAADGHKEYEASMTAIRQRHHDIIEELVPEKSRETVNTIVDSLLDELAGLYQGVYLINELPHRTLNRIVSFGERMSSVIVAAIIKDAQHADSLEFMKTEKWMDRDIAERDVTERLIKERFAIPLKNHFVTGGFISRDNQTGEITNLGRGGSDYTAALIAAALGAELLEIWTDVDGFMTADPRIIPGARVIPRMTFVESMELCSYGAKVIYPPTIYPVFHKNIPIKILNTHNPEAPGTLITDCYKDLPEEVRGVSAIRNAAMVTVRGKLTANVAEINTRTYNAMARAGLSVLMVSQPRSEACFSVSLPSKDADRAIDILTDEFAPELGTGDIASISLQDNLSVLAIVREGIKQLNGLGARIVNTLQRGGLEIKGISDGASDATVAIVVDDEHAVEALNLVHDAVIA